MSSSNIPILTGAQLFISTSVGSTAIAISAASTVIYALELDNTANAAATYLRIYNNSSPTVGTTTADWMQLVPASTKITIVLPSGVTFGTAVSVSAGTSNTLATTTAPSSAFAMKMVYV